MAKHSAAEGLPATIARAQESFQRWRATRSSRGERIPDTLWALAMKAARQHGIWRAARALGLDSGALKRRMDTGGGGSRPRMKRVREPRFVEIRAPAAGGERECFVEVEDATGARLRVRLRGVDGGAIGAMARAFLQDRGA